MTVDLTEYEVGLCIAALQQCAKDLDEGESASARLGTPLSFSAVSADIRNTAEKLSALTSGEQR